MTELHSTKFRMEMNTDGDWAIVCFVVVEIRCYVDRTNEISGIEEWQVLPSWYSAIPVSTRSQIPPMVTTVSHRYNTRVRSPKLDGSLGDWAR